MKNLGAPKNPRKPMTENFRKRKRTLITKADELSHDFNCQVYVLVRRKGSTSRTRLAMTIPGLPAWQKW